jgi:hypothetical protein
MSDDFQVIEGDKRMHIFRADSHQRVLQHALKHLELIVKTRAGPFICVLDIDGTCLNNNNTDQVLPDTLWFYRNVRKTALENPHKFAVQVHYVTARNGRNANMRNKTLMQLRRAGFLKSKRERVYFCDHLFIKGENDIAAQKDVIRQKFGSFLCLTVGDQWGDILAPSAMLEKLQRTLSNPFETSSFILKKVPGLPKHAIGIKLVPDCVQSSLPISNWGAVADQMTPTRNYKEIQDPYKLHIIYPQIRGAGQRSGPDT